MTVSDPLTRNQQALIGWKRRAYAYEFNRKVYKDRDMKTHQAAMAEQRQKSQKMVQGFAALVKADPKAPLSLEDKFAQATAEFQQYTEAEDLALTEAEIMQRAPALFQNEISGHKQEILRLGYLITAWTAEVERLEYLTEKDWADETQHMPTIEEDDTDAT